MSLSRPLPALLLTASLLGCKDKADDSGGALVEQTWMEGYRYHWVAANHRLSFLRAGVEGDEATVALVGGTSTSGVGGSISCDLTCQEFTFLDTSDVTVHWARYTGSDAAFGVGTVELLANATPQSTTVDIPVPAGASGEVTAFITGLRVNTNAPLSGGDACYIPAYGWHPKHIQAEISDASLGSSGDVVTATVELAFEAGLSLEEVRECVDAVKDQAQVEMGVDVLVVVAGGAQASQDVAFTEEWGWRDDNGDLIPQDDPDYASRPLSLGLDNPIAGFSALDYRFHELEGMDRGAYIRDLEWRVDVEAGVASAHALNWSLTQLSGFDYQFTGRVVGVDVAGSIERGTLQIEGLPAQLTDAAYDADPEIFRFALEDGTIEGR